MKGPIKFIIPIIICIAILGFYLASDQQPQIDFPQEHAAILSTIDQEIQYLESIGNSSRMLSDSLILTIAALSNRLQPIETEDVSLGRIQKLSSERGLLLSTLVSKELNTATYQKIFKIATFEHSFLEKADLSNASLDNILLNQSVFKNVDLSNASLVNANLCKVHFKNVNLRAANLNIVNLREANLDGSNLTKANLKNAYMVDAKLEGIQIEGAIFDKANLAGVNLADTARGLGNNN